MRAPMKDWATSGDIRSRVQREWDNGRILTAMLRGEAVFPLRIPLKKPGLYDLAQQFDDVRLWVAELGAMEKNYELEWREFTHRQLGRNRIPVAAIIGSEQEGLALIGKQRDAGRFCELAANITHVFPALAPWLQQYPLKVLDHAGNWPRLLAVLDWIVRHPGAHVYLRQIDATGVDSKFIEQHRGLLGDLLDRVLPPELIHSRYSGARNFELRYGFKNKPVQVRLRFLDRKLSIQGLSDLAVTSDEFARLELSVKRVFITENEINFLAFPEVAEGMVLFGAGYGFDHLARADWLQQKEIFYWGDIDTHGFAILDQLRSKFPSAHSFMMDRATLLEHRTFCGNEDSPISRQLERLRLEESSLYDDLRFNCIAPALRLEQERISCVWVNAALAKAGF